MKIPREFSECIFPTTTQIQEKTPIVFLELLKLVGKELQEDSPNVPWSKVAILGMVIPPLIGILIMGI